MDPRRQEPLSGSMGAYGSTGAFDDSLGAGYNDQTAMSPIFAASVIFSAHGPNMSLASTPVPAVGTFERPSTVQSDVTAEVEVPASGRRRFRLGLVAGFVVAVTARLVPVLHGYGLGALGNYDDGVHFAAAIGLVHGLLPYRDFLLLHPPGVALLLAPFAWLADLLGEPDAMMVARLCWMALAGLNAVL